MRRTNGRGVIAVAALTVGLLGAASGAVGASSDSIPDDSPAASAAAAEPAPASEAPGESAAASGEWTEIVPGGDCQCADGSEFSFFVREADPTKVVFFLQGGGACFDPVTCAFTEEESTTYKWTVANDDPATQGGIFDFENPDNPFADYSVVYVPYCTGDVHLGNTTHEFSPDLTVEFKGAVNGAAAVEYLAENFADAEQVVVVGESAGSVAAPLYSGLISDALADPQITVFADGSGAYPDEPTLNATVGGLWGTMNAVPDWESTEGMTVEEWSLPGLWVHAGTHDPEIVMSRFDYAYDEVQAFFAGLVGIDAADLVTFIDGNEATIEAAGVNQWSFTAPGSDHTLVQKPEFYAMEVAGVTLVDWVADLIAGEEIADVHCEDCETAPTLSSGVPSSGAPGTAAVAPSTG